MNVQMQMQFTKHLILLEVSYLKINKLFGLHLIRWSLKIQLLLLVIDLPVHYKPLAPKTASKL